MTLLAQDIAVGCRRTQARSAPLIVFAGGGTGGHLYPALALTDALTEAANANSDAEAEPAEAADAIRFMFIATDRQIDRDILEAAGRQVIVQPVRAPRAEPWRWLSVVRGWRASVRLCRELFETHRPSVVIGTGAYASAPPVVQAARMGIPTALLNPDVIPGRANRFLARRATVVFAQWAESVEHFGSRVCVEVTGCPVRRAFRTADDDGELESFGFGRFGLSSDRRTLLVTGASQGARSINRALVHLAPDLAGAAGWQVLHIAGRADVDEVRTAYGRAGVAAVCLDYTQQMADALALADLVVSRGGASMLAEITAMGRPSILLPYPHHRDMHQQANAEVLASRGAARVCRDRIDGPTTAQALRQVLLSLMADDDQRRRMADAARRIGAPKAAQTIAQSVMNLARQGDGAPHGGCVRESAGREG